MADQAKIDFNTLSIPEETITADDIKNAEPVGAVPVGKYYCTVVDLYGEEMAFMNPPCVGAIIELSVMFAIEIDKKPAEGEDVLRYQKSKISDSIPMPTEGESDFTRNRRINVANSFGIIPQDGSPMKANAWLELIGKNRVVEYVAKNAKNADGKWEKTNFMHVKRMGGYTEFEGDSGALEMKPEMDVDPIDI